MTEDIQNWPALQTIAIPPAFHEKSPVNFGPQKKFYWLEWATQVDFSGETTFRPLAGAAPQSFIRARDWPSLDSTQPNGDEGPPKKI